jgi:TRAP-type C4-dicarboxylate transport system permease small subunit
MNKLYLSLINLLKYLVIFLSAAIVVVVVIQVFSRFVLQSPSSITEELSRFLLIWIGLLGGAYGYHSNAHLGLDIVTSKLSGSLQKFVGISAHLIIMFFAIAVMITGGVSLVLLTIDPPQISAAMEIKMAYIYSVIPVSGFLIVFISVMKIGAILSNQSNNTKEA